MMIRAQGRAIAGSSAGWGAAARRRTVGIAVLLGATAGLCGLTAAPSVAAPPAAASPAAAAVAPGLPAGWALSSTKDGARLTWTAPAKTTGDARVEFFSGDRLLGIPRPDRDGRRYRLDLAAGSLGDPADLQVRAGGRRLDAAGLAAEARRGPSSDVAATAKAAALPPVSVDPGKAGKYATVTGTYTLPGVKLPDYAAKVEMKAVVVAPKGATGRRPLALFLHGRHSICYGDDNAEEAWPCPAGTKPIPSYRGYLRAQKLLASQGYVTVSISANGINGQDYISEDGGAQARSSLIRLHLAHWADWSGSGRAQAPAIVRKVPRANLSQVLLMGHSRGGEGVNRAAIDSLTPPPAAADGYHGKVRWKIRGTLLLAPTLFGHDPAADVPSVVVLPGCDGDVYDLQGEYSVDGTRGQGTGTALHGAAFVVGANHNYFNSEWTPGLAAAPAWDDWFDPDDAVCGTGSKSLRLTPVQQQKVGATYIAAAARLFVQRDDRVRPLLDGSGVRAPSVSPARVLSHAVGADRTQLVQPAAGLKVAGTSTTKARLCHAVASDSSACVSPDHFTPVPHFVSFYGVSNEPDRYAVALKWSAAGGAGAKLAPARPVSLARSTSVAVRMVVPPNSAARKFDLRITDSAGRRATLGRFSLAGLPATGQTVGSWGQEARVSLKAARKAKLDLGRITQLQVIPRSKSGQAFLLDAWGWRAGTPTPRVLATARIDVGTLGTVMETDSAVTYRVPVTVSGRGFGKIRTYTVDAYTGESSTRLVSIKPGTRHLDLPITVPGDDAYGYGGYYGVLAEAVKGTVVGDFIGLLEVTEDDPVPTLSVTPIADDVTEGETLKWRLQLSGPAAVDLYLPMVLAPPAGTELSTTDLPAEWVENNLFVDPLPSRPLSDTGSLLDTVIPPGETTLDVETPTVTDSLVEGPEQIRYQVIQPEGKDDPVEATGTVSDAP